MIDSTVRADDLGSDFKPASPSVSFVTGVFTSRFLAGDLRQEFTASGPVMKGEGQPLEVTKELPSEGVDHLVPGEDDLFESASPLRGHLPSRIKVSGEALRDMRSTCRLCRIRLKESPHLMNHCR